MFLRALRTLGGYSTAVIFSALIGIWATRVLFETIGATRWADFILAQTVATISGILVAYGWGATGAATVAALSVNNRPAMYLQSVRIRLVLFAIVAPIACAIVYLLTRGDLLIALFATTTYLLPMLGATWYFVGQGSPKRFLLFDSAPGLLGTVAATIAVSVTHELWTYVAAQALGYVLAISGSFLRVRADGRGVVASNPPRLWRDVLRDQRHAVTTTLTSGLYVSLPYLAVSIFARPNMGIYGLADRTLKYGTVAYSPVQQYFQGWVAAHGEDTRSRAVTATKIAIGLGLVGGVGLATLMGPFTAFLSGSNVSVPLEICIPLGFAFWAIAVSAIVGYACLPALGETRALAVSTVIGAATGTPLIIAAAIAGNLVLVAAALAVSEAVVATYQVYRLHRALKTTA